MNKTKRRRVDPLLDLVDWLIAQRDAQKELKRPKRKNRYVLIDEDGSPIVF